MTQKEAEDFLEDFLKSHDTAAIISSDDPSYEMDNVVKEYAKRLASDGDLVGVSNLPRYEIWNKTNDSVVKSLKTLEAAQICMNVLGSLKCAEYGIWDCKICDWVKGDC